MIDLNCAWHTSQWSLWKWENSIFYYFCGLVLSVESLGILSFCVISDSFWDGNFSPFYVSYPLMSDDTISALNFTETPTTWIFGLKLPVSELLWNPIITRSMTLKNDIINYIKSWSASCKLRAQCLQIAASVVSNMIHVTGTLPSKQWIL